jgi:hypothetical protein
VVWQLRHLTPAACGLNAGDRCLYAGMGLHAVVRWQASQERELAKWLEGLPFAVDPLWQVAQVFGATLVCVNVDGSQAVVRWHVSQDAEVIRCLPGLPGALTPL